MAYVDLPIIVTTLSKGFYSRYSVLTNPSSPENISDLQSQLHVGIYVDDFVFYSSDPAQEALFKTLLQEHIQVNFMGGVDYFLGTAFTWLKHADRKISVHLCQSAFTEFTAHRFSVHTSNKVPNMTPYLSGFPINSIPPVDPLDPDLPRQNMSMRVSLAASIVCRLALALTLPLHSPFLPRTEILPILKITRPQSMLSNT